MIDPLPRTDRLHLNAAEGWMGLGDAREAMASLKSIAEPNQGLPPVLEVYWAVYADLKEWRSAFQAAEQLVKSCPNRCSGWVHRAYALRRMEGGGLEKAWAALLPAATKFPEEPIIPYNLACYATQLNRLDDAGEWLQKALKIGHAKALLKMALEDPDFEPLKATGYFD